MGHAPPFIRPVPRGRNQGRLPPVRLARSISAFGLANQLGIGREEAGARDALSEAFEALKKYEHVNDAHATAARKEQDRRDTAALDELGLRRMSGR